MTDNRTDRAGTSARRVIRGAGLIGGGLLAAAVLGGCDFFGSQAKNVEIIRLEQQKAERVAAEKKDAAAALRVYITGRCRLVTNETARIMAAHARVVADAARLEKAVAAGLAANPDKPYGRQLAEVLADATVGELAQTYLSAGFSAQRGALLARLDEVERQEKAYADAIEKAKASFNEKDPKTANWQTEGKDAVRAEITRLSAEVTKLESRLHSARNTLISPTYTEQRRKETLFEIESQLAVKRRRLEFLRKPTSQQDIESDSVARQIRARDHARSVYQAELRDTERHLKPKTTSTQVAQDVEGQTLGALRKKLQDEKQLLAAAVAEIAVKKTLAEGYLLEVGVCDDAELKNLRRRVDQTLAPKKGQ